VSTKRVSEMTGDEIRAMAGARTPEQVYDEIANGGQPAHVPVPEGATPGERLVIAEARVVEAKRRERLWAELHMAVITDREQPRWVIGAVNGAIAEAMQDTDRAEQALRRLRQEPKNT
jgi:hypothetical protein